MGYAIQIAKSVEQKVKKKDLYVITAALAAGYLGGVISAGSHVRASSPEVLRASKFVLVNAAGTPVATWDVDTRNGVRLAFLGPHGARLALGARPDRFPYLEINGDDGKNRIKTGLGLSDKPYLAMSDERWQARVALGFIAPDTIPYPPDSDSWGLVFRAFGSSLPVVGMHMSQRGDGPVQGSLTVMGRQIQ